MGLRRGLFALGQLSYAPQQALQIYGTPNWQPTESWHYGAGYVPDERQAKVLAFVAKGLNLKPFCYSSQVFSNLQRRWLPKLQMSDEYYEMTGERR